MFKNIRKPWQAALFIVVTSTAALISVQAQANKLVFIKRPTPPGPIPSAYPSASLNNGIISFTADTNGYPMITTLSILGTQVMPFDNAGAGFQMAARSSAGNAYNPTQAGDCNGVASQLNSETIPWSPSDLKLPSANGLLFDVTPRNYDGGSSTACLTSQAPLPYTFTFGVTLGDGIQIAKQGMLIDMSITRQPGSQPIELNISELPSIYPLASIFPYAYWSPNGVTFNALNYNGTNDIHSWPYTQNMYVTGQAVMLCSSGNTICIALYSNSTTQMLISHRQGAHYELGLMTLIAAQSGTISDYTTHTARKILAVGTPATVSTVIAGAKATITNWGDIQ